MTDTATEPKPSSLLKSKLLQSGIIFTAIIFLTNVGNSVFLMIQGRYLVGNEFGLSTAANVLVGLLGQPLTIAIFAVTHYIARYKASGQEAHLNGLLLGCQRLLFRFTLGGSILAVVALKPMGDFFHLPRPSLVLVSACCVIVGLWGGFATALCQGLAWFKRLALIGLLGAVLRIAFGWAALAKFPVAEAAIMATAVMVLANLVLLFWRKDLRFSHHEASVSPWDLQFAQFLILGAAWAGGSYCLQQGDVLVAARHFSPAQLDPYTKAERLAQTVILLVGPLLQVLFTHRSTGHKREAVLEQFKLLGLFAAALVVGAIGVIVFRKLGIRILNGTWIPAAAVMVPRLALTMIFVGLLQALGTWALASRWSIVSLLYGALGLGYWIILLLFGNTPARLLFVMPIAAGIAFAILLAAWVIVQRNARKHGIVEGLDG